MILGNAAWGFRETPFERQLAVTREMGFDLLELQIAGHENDFLQLNASDENILQVKKLFKQYSIKLSCASTSNDFTFADEDECIASMQNVKKVIDIAQKLEIKYLRIFAGFSPVEDVVGRRWDVMIEMLNEVAKYAEQRNIVPAIETHGGVKNYLDGINHFNSTTTVPAKLRQLLNELSYPVGIVFDPSNLGAVGLDEAQIIALFDEFKNRISYIHIKDFRKKQSGAIEPCACGAGLLDWANMMTVFSKFSGIGMIEYELTEDIIDGLKYSYDFLKKCL